MDIIICSSLWSTIRDAGFTALAFALGAGEQQPA